MTLQSIGHDPSNLHSLFHHRHQDLNAIASAAQSGNIAGAQTAQTSYEKNVQAIGARSGQSRQSTGYPGASKLQSDPSGLTTAIQGGSVTNAQRALQAYQQDRGSSGISPPSDTNSPGASSLLHDLTKFVKDTEQGNSSALGAELQNLFGSGAAPQTGATQTNSQSQSASAGSSFVQDLTKLVNDTKNGNASTIQADTASIATDVRGLSNGGQATGVGEHHHHHHNGSEGTSSAAQQTASAQQGLLSALGNDGDSDDAGATPPPSTVAGTTGASTTTSSSTASDPAAAAIALQYQLSQTLLSDAFGSSQTIGL